MWSNFEFQHPAFLWLLLVIPFLVLWYFFTHRKNTAVLTISNTEGFNSGADFLSKLKPFLCLLRLLALSFLFIALARPQNVAVTTKIKANKGIDIVMAIDVSASMLAKDLKPSRLEALKKVATKFVN